MINEYDSKKKLGHKLISCELQIKIILYIKRLYILFNENHRMGNCDLFDFHHIKTKT